MKGLENKMVILHNFSAWKTKDEDGRWVDYEEDLLKRIQFVGCTRAREKLYIYFDRFSNTKSRYSRGFIPKDECSIINTIPEELYDREEI